MMDSIAMMAMDMKQMSFAQNYSIALMDNVMETQEAQVENLLEMLPPAPSGAQFIDVYA